MEKKLQAEAPIVRFSVCGRAEASITSREESVKLTAFS